MNDERCDLLCLDARGESCCTVPVVPGENCEDDC
jgi:hypothetical protein